MLGKLLGKSDARAFALVLVIAGMVAVSARAQDGDPIPEPDITFFGSAPAGSAVSIDHPSGVLGSDTAGAADPYILKVKLVQPVVTPTPAPPAGKAYIGDAATVVVDGVAQGRITLEERGAVYRLDIPNPAKTPSPNAILSPVRVVSTVPPFACGDVTCTPTPTPPVSATPTPTRTIGTPNASVTLTPTATPTATGTPVESTCMGDCNRNGRVTVDELATGVDISIQNAGSSRCSLADRNHDDRVSVDELVGSVGSALKGCPREAK